MKCIIPEISWHNREPVLSVDFQFQNGEVQRLATGGSDCHVLICLVNLLKNGTADLEFVADLVRHNRAVNIVRFSSSGELLASGDDEAAIWLWKQSEVKEGAADLFSNETEKENKENWAPLRALRGHIEDVYDLCWSPDSNFLISGSVDNTAIIWDTQKGRSIGILSEHKGFVQGVTWDPKNQFVATQSTDRMVRVYNISTKRVCHRIHKIALPQNGGEPSKSVRMFHDDTLKSFCRRLTFTPDGELLIAPAGFLEFENGKSLNTTYVFARNALNKPALYLPTKDKYTVAVRCCPVLFKLRDIPVPTKKDDEEKSEKSNSSPYKVFNLPYRTVFAVATQSSVLLYDTQQPIPFGHVSNIHYTRLTDLAWSKDGRILIISSTDGYCSIVTFQEGELGEVYYKSPPNTPTQCSSSENVTPPQVPGQTDRPSKKESSTKKKVSFSNTVSVLKIRYAKKGKAVKSVNAESSDEATNKIADSTAGVSTGATKVSTASNDTSLPMEVDCENCESDDKMEVDTGEKVETQPEKTLTTPVKEKSLSSKKLDFTAFPPKIPQNIGSSKTKPKASVLGFSPVPCDEFHPANGFDVPLNSGSDDLEATSDMKLVLELSNEGVATNKDAAHNAKVELQSSSDSKGLPNVKKNLVNAETPKQPRRVQFITLSSPKDRKTKPNKVV